MNRKRPVNLDLRTIHQPLSAIASITHRITGVLLFAGVAVLLWLLDLSLSSAAGFAQAAGLVNSPLLKLVVWVVLSALAYHMVAGVKHLLLDRGIGDSREGAQTGAKLTFIVSALLIVLMGFWVW
ncbi:MAG: succinate dehydrogenase, cytochrome b556 subunit [Pseudomonadales bacterium]|nr:succinate dehydrogenase, cytochrome b556 subunit [Pseudomonadales bacterium]